MQQASNEFAANKADCDYNQAVRASVIARATANLNLGE